MSGCNISLLKTKKKSNNSFSEIRQKQGGSGKNYQGSGNGNLKRKTAAAGSYGSYSKKGSKNSSKNKNYKNNRYVQEEKPAQKKGFLAKLKAFFGR